MSCIKCRESGDCGAEDKQCHIPTGLCVECLQKSDCYQNETCHQNACHLALGTTPTTTVAGTTTTTTAAVTTPTTTTAVTTPTTTEPERPQNRCHGDFECDEHQICDPKRNVCKNITCSIESLQEIALTSNDTNEEFQFGENITAICQTPLDLEFPIPPQLVTCSKDGEWLKPDGSRLISCPQVECFCPGQVCDIFLSDICVDCNDDSDCESDKYCMDGNTCQQKCHTNTDCPNGLNCNNNGLCKTPTTTVTGTTTTTTTAVTTPTTTTAVTTPTTTAAPFTILDFCRQNQNTITGRDGRIGFITCREAISFGVNSGFCIQPEFLDNLQNCGFVVRNPNRFRS